MSIMTLATCPPSLNPAGYAPVLKQMFFRRNHSIPKNNLNSTHFIPFYTYKTKIMNFDSFYEVVKFEGVPYI